MSNSWAVTSNKTIITILMLFSTWKILFICWGREYVKEHHCHSDGINRRSILGLFTFKKYADFSQEVVYWFIIYFNIRAARFFCRSPRSKWHNNRKEKEWKKRWWLMSMSCCIVPFLVLILFLVTSYLLLLLFSPDFNGRCQSEKSYEEAFFFRL